MPYESFDLREILLLIPYLAFYVSVRLCYMLILGHVIKLFTSAGERVVHFHSKKLLTQKL